MANAEPNVTKISKPLRPQPPGAMSMAQEPRGDGEKIEKVRELLFGARLREQEKQFQNLQDKITNQIQETRLTFEQKLSNLEVFLKQELNSVTNRIKTEHEGWERAWEKGISDLSSLRELVLEKTKLLADDFKSAQRKHEDQVARDIKFLSDTKLARSQMVEMLNAWSLNIGYSAEEEKNA